MGTRRTGTITALLLTAALFLAMPGAVRSCLPKDENRMDERLRPSKLRTLTVWLLPGAMEADSRLIRQLCSQFEKENSGARIFLRTARAEELYAENVVLPDAVLFDTGAITAPEGVLLPLAGESHASRTFGGVSYALPLWLDVNVLCLPVEWTGHEDGENPSARESLLGQEAPVQQTQLLTAETLPWERLLESGSIHLPTGIALQQLTLMCPVALRPRLPGACGEGGAEVRTLSRHIALGDGKAACLMTPALSDHVRYIGLCRDSEEARALVRLFAQSQEALRHHLLPLAGGESADGLMGQALSLFGEVFTLPNAFAHSREGLESLCLHAFQSGLDPVETLLKLR